MRGARRRVVVVGLPFWLGLLAWLGTGAAARAVSLPSRPERQAGVATFCPDAAPGPWVWHWLNPNAPAPFDEAEPSPPPSADAGTGAGEAPAPFTPDAPPPDEMPRPAAHAGHGSDSMGGTGSGSSSNGGPGPTGLTESPPTDARPPLAARVYLVRTVLLLTEHHDRVFRPPRIAGGIHHRLSWIV